MKKLQQLGNFSVTKQIYFTLMSWNNEISAFLFLIPFGCGVNVKRKHQHQLHIKHHILLQNNICRNHLLMILSCASHYNLSTPSIHSLEIQSHEKHIFIQEALHRNNSSVKESYKKLEIMEMEEET
ncbi:CLUMA_CG019311, isoform A [Clunio marinus]|uniref:CLUMA_CG019311, isoform A n=1 Tax=Clunio marinus TaxID=568069 RepID=A0A1J1J2V4_9DIPT|nr:CLUMA_CG019311, isoform A [Clunio marinus]